MTRWFTLIAMLVAGWAMASAAAQDPAEREERERSFIGRQIARIALIDYRLQPDPDPSDAAAAAEILQLARAYRPEDPHVLRYLIQARREAADDAGVIAATRDLLRLDPDDEIALLRLLAWNISQRETAEARLEAYSFWLDGRGSGELADKPALRSRLAVDAALLHRELGNERAFVERLDQAARLDATNKEAALLIATYFAGRREDPVGRLELAINVLLADPVDPNLHLSIADQLVRLEAFEQAARFHRNGVRLASTLGDGEQTALVTESTALDWHLVGPEVLLRNFEQYLANRKRAAALAVERRIELGESADDLPDPNEVRLSLDRERFRLFAAVAIGDRVAAERSITDLRNTVEPAIDRIANEISLLTPQQERERLALVGRAIELATEVIIAQLIADVQVRSAEGGLRELETRYGEALRDQIGQVGALLVLRTGTPEEARLALEPYEDRSMLGAVGAAMAAEQLGETERAVTLYERAARFGPLTPTGVFARTKAEQLIGEPLAPPAESDAAAAVAAAVPTWIDAVAARPRNIIRLDASVVQQQINAFGEAELVIEMRNLLPRAIGLGADRPVNTRFAIASAIDIASHPLPSENTPEVIDLHRRLRLEPGEVARFSVWPNPGLTGLVQEIKGGHRIHARWNALQGFVSGRGVPFSAGPLSLSAESELLVRRPDPNVRLPAEDMIRNADVASESRLLELLPAYRSALIDVDRVDGPLSDADAEALARGLAARYPTLPADLRMAVVAVMPTGFIRESLRPLDEALLAETDPRVLRLVLMTRVHEADHPVLRRAAGSNDAALAAFAERLAARWSDPKARGFATMGPPPSHLPAVRDESARGR